MTEKQEQKIQSFLQEIILGRNIPIACIGDMPRILKIENEATLLLAELTEQNPIELIKALNKD